MDPKKLFVGNLSWSLNNQSLHDIFSQFGEVVEAVVITDRATGRSKGFGFVTFARVEDAEAAMNEMANKEVEGRPMVVNVARPQEARPQGGHRGGYNRDARRSY